MTHSTDCHRFTRERERTKLKEQNRDDVIARKTAWHPSAWGYTRLLTVEATLSNIEKSMTSGLLTALKHDHITVQTLAQCLPVFQQDLHRKFKLIYCIIGSHDDGRWAAYPGSSINPRSRFCHNTSGIAAVRANKKDEKHQHVDSWTRHLYQLPCEHLPGRP